MSFRKEFIHYIVFALLFVLLCIATYFNMGNPEAFGRMLLAIALVDIPIFVVLELFILRLQATRADKSYEINALRLQTIRFFQWIKDRDLAEEFFTRAIVEDERQAVAHINLALHEYGVHITSISEINNVLNRRQELLQKASGSRFERRRIKSLLDSLRAYDPKKLVAPYLNMYNQFLCGSLSFSRYETKFSLFAFAISFASFSFGLYALLQIPIDWTIIGHIAAPLIIQGIFFIFNADSELYWQKRILTETNEALSKIMDGIKTDEQN